MRGMKLWVSTFCDDPLVFPLAEQCAAYDIPVLVHAFHKSVGQLPYESVGENVANLAKRYPGVRFIMAHLGANGYRELKSVRRCEKRMGRFLGIDDPARRTGLRKRRYRRRSATVRNRYGGGAVPRQAGTVGGFGVYAG